MITVTNNNGVYYVIDEAQRAEFSARAFVEVKAEPTEPKAKEAPKKRGPKPKGK